MVPFHKLAARSRDPESTFASISPPFVYIGACMPSVHPPFVVSAQSRVGSRTANVPRPTTVTAIWSGVISRSWKFSTEKNDGRSS